MARFFITPLMRAVWHEMMVQDAALPHVAPRVGIQIGTHFNNSTAETFVAQRTIARELSISPRAVFGAITALKKRDHLVVRHGGRASNYYGMPVEKVAAECEVYLEKRRSRVRGSWDKRSQNPAEKVAAECERSPLPTEEINSTGAYRRPVTELRGRKAASRGKQGPAVFKVRSDQWKAWLAYHDEHDPTRAAVMRSTAESSRYGEWSETTSWPPATTAKAAE